MPTSMGDKANALAKKWIRELLDTDHSQTAIAKIAGTSQGRISRIHAGKEGTSADVLMALGRHLHRADEAARALNGGRPLGIADFIEDADRYPNRAIAKRIAREAGYRDDAIQDVAEARLDADTDQPVKWWLEKIQELDRAYSNPFAKRKPPGRREKDDL